MDHIAETTLSRIISLSKTLRKSDEELGCGSSNELSRLVSHIYNNADQYNAYYSTIGNLGDILEYLSKDSRMVILLAGQDKKTLQRIKELINYNHRSLNSVNYYTEGSEHVAHVISIAHGFPELKEDPLLDECLPSVVHMKAWEAISREEFRMPIADFLDQAALIVAAGKEAEVSLIWNGGLNQLRYQWRVVPFRQTKSFELLKTFCQLSQHSADSLNIDSIIGEMSDLEDICEIPVNERTPEMRKRLKYGKNSIREMVEGTINKVVYKFTDGVVPELISINNGALSSRYIKYE